MRRKMHGARQNNAPQEIQLILAMANEVLHGIGFRDRIDQSVKWDETQCDVTPGNLASALVLTMFFDKRPPLWRVDEWYAAMNTDTQALFGKKASCEKLNDDALGRMLDKLYEAGLGNLFMQISAQAIAKYAIAYKRIHADTTTLSFYGEYEADVPIDIPTDAPDGIPSNTPANTPADIPTAAPLTHVRPKDGNKKVVRIVPGYSKDHRPECKQVVVGKMVTEQGIPLAMATMDGNTSDVAWNGKALDLLEQLNRQGLQHGVYGADSKLMTQTLFERMTDPKRPIRFVSRVPANFANKLEQRVLEMAYAQDEWKDMGQYGNGKRASFYCGQCFEVEVHGKMVKALALRSGAGNLRFERKLERCRQEMEKAIAQVSAKRFACLADAQMEYDRFVKCMRRNPYIADIDCVSWREEKRAAGRPSTKAPKAPTVVERWGLRSRSLRLDPLRAQALKQQEESFVLLSNCSEFDEQEILRTYKGQQVVEIDFRYLKDPSVGSAILLKTPERIEALLMLLHVGLLVSSLLQYRLRKGRKAWKKPVPKIGWNGAVMMEAPTTYYLECKVSGSFFRAVPGSPGEYELLLRRLKDITIILEMMDMSGHDMMAALQ